MIQCVAVQEMIRDGELRGEIKGIVTMCRKFNQSFESTVLNVLEQFELSQEVVEDYVREFWDSEKNKIWLF